MPPADTGTRAATRVLAIYNLGGRLRVPAATYSLARHFDLGRFAGHVQATASLLPQMTAWARFEPGQLRLASGPFAVRVGGGGRGAGDHAAPGRPAVPGHRAGGRAGRGRGG